MNLAIIIGLTSVILVLLLGQSRIFYSMARDGCWEFAGNATCRWELTFPLHVRRSEFRGNAREDVPGVRSARPSVCKSYLLIGECACRPRQRPQDALLRGSQVSTILIGP